MSASYKKAQEKGSKQESLFPLILMFSHGQTSNVFQTKEIMLDLGLVVAVVAM